jgi:hypothetical protein
MQFRPGDLTDEHVTLTFIFDASCPQSCKQSSGLRGVPAPPDKFSNDLLLFRCAPHNLGDSTVDLSQFLKHEISLVAEGDPQEATAESGT